ncbi:MBL fold metallo-hydrolase [Psychrobacillus sp.]|uniref:MBL fold metallo-hydrolase n=1 Tax=Psychrobacillus sp. TaxID=1871623 RepID=UPI0028BDD413|nr:MBL fold metallo-hydrolase [Psychrobacillus sp.]
MLEKITDRIYYMLPSNETGRPLIGLVIGDNYCLVVDSGNSPKHANEFKLEIEKMNLPPVKYLVLTHHHCDHTFGLNEWDVVSIANQKTSDYINVYRDIKYDNHSLELAKEMGILNDFLVGSIKDEIPDREKFSPKNVDISFEGQLKIDLGGITCELRQIVSPHTDDSTILYIPEEKTLFLGDCVYGQRIDGYNHFDDKLMFPMIQILEEYESEYYVCSHEPVCSKDEIVDFWEQVNIGFVIANKCSSLEEGLVEYKNQFDKEPTNNAVFFMKSFGLR